MKIYVRSEQGVSASLAVNPYDKIYEVKNKVVEEGGASSRLHHLFFEGKRLEDGRTLCDYGVKGDSVLRLDSLAGRLRNQPGFRLERRPPERHTCESTAQPEIPKWQTEDSAWSRIETDGIKVEQLVTEVANNDPSLTGIHLWNEGIGAESASRLAGAVGKNGHVLELSLYNNKIGPVGAAALMGALRENETLQRLYFGSNEIGEEGLEALADLLCQNSALRAIVLREAGIGGVGTRALAVSLCQNSTLRKLDLWNNDIGSEGAAALSTALGVSQSLTQLGLSANKICSKGAEILAGALKRKCALTRLDLGANCIGERGTEAIAKSLAKNSVLLDLCLSSNKIGDKGAKELAGALCINSSLEKLDLRDNGIGMKGAESLACALRLNGSLSKLVLHENNIADEGTTAMARALKVNRTMAELYLCDNYISDAGASALLEVARQTTSLVLLDLRGNAVDASLENNIRSLLRSKREQSSAVDITDVSFSSTNPVEKGRKVLKSVLSLSDLGPAQIPYQYVEFSTNNFSDDNLLAEGSFGRVFSGIDSGSGLEFIVKALCNRYSLHPGMSEAHSVIKKEIEALASFRHPNVARLSGYCVENKSGRDSCLVYTVGAEGSLQEWLESRKKRNLLHWTTRINIAEAIARTVQFFGTTKASESCYLNIQSSTISLSEDLSPVLIPDLITADDQDMSVVERVQGKCDDDEIYSLGIVFAELLTGVQHDFSGGNIAIYTDKCAGEWNECLREEFTHLIWDCIDPDSGSCPLIEDVVYRLRILAAKALPYSWERHNHLTVFCSSPLVWEDNEGNLNPIQYGPDFELEKRLILSCLEESKRDISVTFDVATFNRLQMAVASRSRCLHFSGHGLPNQLLFEDGFGGANFLSGDMLHDCVHAEPCQFFFVSACFSQFMGEALVRAGVQHVVCCEQSSELEDRAAAEFTHLFYFSVFKGFTITDAFQKGKRTVRAKYGEGEANKFLLLPENGDHSIPLFDGAASGTVKHAERESFIPAPITDCIHPLQTNTFMLLQLILKHRLVTVVGGESSERSSVASAVCRFINKRKSIFLGIQSIHYLQRRTRPSSSQHGCSFTKSLYCRLLAEGKVDKFDCKALEECIIEALDGTPSLIVFDEICIDDNLISFISEVLEVTGTVKFLVTSRIALNDKRVAVDECVFPLRLSLG